MIEATGEDTYILKYDAIPAWLPAPVRRIETQESTTIELRRSFIETKCKEWK